MYVSDDATCVKHGKRDAQTTCLSRGCRNCNLSCDQLISWCKWSNGERRRRSASYRVDREVWEAKWKLFETKKRWPSLGLTREEEEIITGRSSRESAMVMGTVNAAMLGGREALQAQRENLPSSLRKKVPDKDRDERERRDRGLTEMQRLTERTLASHGGRLYTSDALKERMQALRQKQEEAIAKLRQADADWDDVTDVSFLVLDLGLMLIVALVLLPTLLCWPWRARLSTCHCARSSTCGRFLPECFRWSGWKISTSHFQTAPR